MRTQFSVFLKLVASALVLATLLRVQANEWLEETVFDEISHERLNALELELSSAKQSEAFTTAPTTKSTAATTQTVSSNAASSSQEMNKQEKSDAKRYNAPRAVQCPVCPTNIPQLAWNNNPQYLSVQQEVCGIQPQISPDLASVTANIMPNVFIFVGVAGSIAGMGGASQRKAFFIREWLHPTSGAIGNGYTITANQATSNPNFGAPNPSTMIIVDEPIGSSTYASQCGVDDISNYTVSATGATFLVSAGFSTHDNFNGQTSLTVGANTYAWLGTDLCRYTRRLSSDSASWTDDAGYSWLKTNWVGRTVAQKQATCRSLFPCGRWGSSMHCLKSRVGEANVCTGSMFSTARANITTISGVTQTLSSTNTPVNASTITISSVFTVNTTATCFPRVVILGDPFVANNIGTSDLALLKYHVFQGGTLIANLNRFGPGAQTLLRTFVGTNATVSSNSVMCCNCTAPTTMTWTSGTTSLNYVSSCYSGMDCLGTIGSNYVSVRANDTSAGFGSASATFCEVTYALGKAIFVSHWHPFMNTAAYAGRSGHINAGNNLAIWSSMFQYPNILN